MRVYVGAKFENKDAVREVHRALRDAGHEVSYDWTPHSAQGFVNTALVDKMRHEAEEDFDGVRNADAIIFLHDSNCQGGFIEVGIALGSGKLVCVVGGRPDGQRFPLFYFHPCVQMFDTVEAAINFLTWTNGAFARPTEGTYRYDR